MQPSRGVGNPSRKPWRSSRTATEGDGRHPAKGTRRSRWRPCIEDPGGNMSEVGHLLDFAPAPRRKPYGTCLTATRYLDRTGTRPESPATRVARYTLSADKFRPLSDITRRKRRPVHRTQLSAIKAIKAAMAKHGHKVSQSTPPTSPRLDGSAPAKPSKCVRDEPPDGVAGCADAGSASSAAGTRCRAVRGPTSWKLDRPTVTRSARRHLDAGLFDHGNGRQIGTSPRPSPR